MYSIRKSITYTKAADWVILSVAMMVTVWLFATIWFDQDLTKPDYVIVRSSNQVIASILLPAHQRVTAEGPLGKTTILIDGYRARVLTDPSPRQYCVLQGWLSQPGDVSICLPNQIALYMPSARPNYDSINY